MKNPLYKLSKQVNHNYKLRGKNARFHKLFLKRKLSKQTAFEAYLKRQVPFYETENLVML